MKCPLCSGSHIRPLPAVGGRDYSCCGSCGLAFMHPSQRPTFDEERTHYAFHQNHPADERYRRFLSRITEPLVPLLQSGACGLDYGCGPGPTLSVMLREAGFNMRDYDPCFAPGGDALRDSYDFITCSETVEHFHQPAEEFRRLDRLLRPGGWLAVMTEMMDDIDDRFVNWWYVRDPTHVCFYRPRTMQWLAQWRHWTMSLAPSPNVTLFQKGPVPREFP